jgi:hypothetical protein
VAAPVHEVLRGGQRENIKKTIIIYPLYGYLLIPILIIGFAGILVFQDNPLGTRTTFFPSLWLTWRTSRRGS